MRQRIDEEGKWRLFQAVCNGKITVEMYEETAGESVAQTVKRWYRVMVERDRAEITEREKRGLITPEECLFILGEGPEPESPLTKRADIWRNPKSPKNIDLAIRNIQSKANQRMREVRGRMLGQRSVQFQRIIDTVKKHEAGEISRGELEKELWNTYPRILKHLYGILQEESRMMIGGAMESARLSLAERREILEQD